MPRAACLILVVALGTTPDVAHLFRLDFQQSQSADVEKPAPQGNLPSPVTEAPAAKPKGDSAQTSRRSPHLTENSRVAIIRAISGEFVRAQISLPGGKAGFHLEAAQAHSSLTTADKQQGDNPFSSGHVLVVGRAPVIHQGDQVQITRIEFRDKSIVFDINGGGRAKFHLRDHLQFSVGGAPVSGSSVQSSQAGGLEGQGSTIFLDFGHKLPDLSPEDIKLRLSPILDFDSHRSAAVQYADALPPKFQQAIKNGIAAIGMDHDMVIAAMGRPNRKVRERNDDGVETEDWIYGTPPGKTIFVTFIGEKVVRVEQFN
ncbi:MAG TPA: hypothetical protein VLW54_01640 [Candidatus Acidoferrales bacterium]|nr:hypothetical protein [Candidatus Acidoferrales bacterium]